MPGRPGAAPGPHRGRHRPGDGTGRLRKGKNAARSSGGVFSVNRVGCQQPRSGRAARPVSAPRLPSGLASVWRQSEAPHIDVVSWAECQRPTLQTCSSVRRCVWPKRWRDHRGLSAKGSSWMFPLVRRFFPPPPQSLHIPDFVDVSCSENGPLRALPCLFSGLNKAHNPDGRPAARPRSGACAHGQAQKNSRMAKLLLAIGIISAHMRMANVILYRPAVLL